ncbi:site-specific integrase [Aeromonas bestiarum]|uniref:Tyrosine-type recombinase/integrase n=1 Tax=Aeromonas bestiarum TaxID=105751 RepID=A0ABT7PYP6_9GAMM|nr:site-specific integrase [Aeromonas bestiarum]MDM5072198.1 tyrosine-type recombinase/integrase [Aeromonas bestiarum]
MTNKQSCTHQVDDLYWVNLMNLWLSKHGIWYFRKVTTLPCGSRKEIKKSLATRDKRAAQAKVIDLLACKGSRAAAIRLEVSPKPKTPPATTKPIKADQQVKRLSLLIDSYLREKALSWAPKEVKNQRSYIQHFIEKSGDKVITGYTKQDAVTFKDYLLGSGKSPATINKYLAKLALLFKWLAGRIENLSNPFDGLKLQRVKEVNSRSGYTDSELSKYIAWANQQQDFRKWILLLGAYSGARANEICQLYASDIRQEQGVWCLHVRAAHDDQKLKTANSERLIPIHSKLIESGFLKFAGSRSGGRLFPELKFRQDSYSHLFGQWFSRHRPLDKDFHSLRHTVASKLKAVGTPLQFAAAILGHTNGAISYDRYGCIFPRMAIAQ